MEYTIGQNAAIDAAVNTMDNVMIMGDAGSGKSTVINAIKDGLKSSSKSFAVLAPTGVAACNVGGSTIHSFMGLPPIPLVPKNVIKRLRKKSALFNVIDTIIIDEVSMVRSDMMHMIDYALKYYRKNQIEPFGGVQMILAGDLSQLRPVVNNRERDFIDNVYGGEFFFDYDGFDVNDFVCVYLKSIFRQKDTSFTDILNGIKYGTATQSMIDKINDVCYRRGQYDPTFITLCSTNSITSMRNAKAVNTTPGEQFVFKATGTGSAQKWEENDAGAPVPYMLKLKEGMRVMTLINSAPDYYNGTIGQTSKIDNDGIHILCEHNRSKRVTMPKHTWEMLKYETNSKATEITTKVAGTWTTYPIVLATAITIHKSQGKQFKHMNLDLGRGAFSSGQTYVALSRCESMEGITLLQKLRMDSIIVDKKAIGFIQLIQNISIV